MKIGIVTFWEAFDNYGQALQCWALQQVLKKLGHDPFVIRYKIQNDNQKGFIYTLHRLYAIAKQTVKGELREAHKQRKNNALRDFKSFRRLNYNLSSKCYFNLEDLISNPPFADAYIVGSDQVWGYKIREKESNVFFLDFGNANTRRIAYAPSFGVLEYPEELKELLKKRLSRFNAISVREKTGVAICESVGVKAEHVLDPSLLLSINDYIKLVTRRTSKDNRLFIYSINIKTGEDIRWSEIKDYAKAMGLKVVATTSSGYIPAKELLEGAYYEYSKVEEWLSNIADSNLVVTTSFHGVAFSVIFHTPFVYVPLTGSHSSGNSRVLELLESLQLTSRVLTADNTFEKVTNESIDWERVEAAISTYRQESLDYLKKALKLAN